MSKAIEETLKALTAFESQLDAAKAEALEARRVMIKRAGEWAEAAKAESLAEAQRIAAETVTKAQVKAEAEGQSTRSKGETVLKSFEESLTRRKEEAAELVTRMLLGEPS